MKCSSRRNCDLDIRNGMAGPCCLNEVQFPKELRLTVSAWEAQLIEASMKCRSRKNCDRSTCRTSAARWCLNEVQPRRNCDLEICSQKSLFDGLNEVQFPKELRPGVRSRPPSARRASMKCSSRRNCDQNDYTALFTEEGPQ